MSDDTCPFSICIGGNPHDVYEYGCTLPKGHDGEHEAHDDEADIWEGNTVSEEEVDLAAPTPKYQVTSLTIRWTNGKKLW